MNSHGGRADGLDPRYEQLRHAALHARAEAFPLGLAVLTGRGVTGWRHAVADLAADQPVAATPPSPAASLPTTISAQLVDTLAAVALAGTQPDRDAVIHHRNIFHHSYVRRERSPYQCSPTPPHPR